MSSEGLNSLVCPCGSDRIIKHGEYRRKRTRTLVQRYRCHECGNTFSDQTFAKTYRQHRPDLNDKILEDVSNGKGIRRMALSFRTTKKTVQRKVRFLARCCDSFHRKYMGQWTRSSAPRFQFGEMQTIEAHRAATVTVPVVAEVDSHFIVATGPAYESSRMGETIVKDTLEMCRVMKPFGKIDVESDTKNLFPIKNVMACLRTDKAMLRRSSRNICKDRKFLSDHLKIYTFYSNYLKKKGYKESVRARGKKRIIYRTPAMHLGIFDRPVYTRFLLDHC